MPKLTLAATTDHLVISQVQVAGATADDEFIEIYNPTSGDINLETLPFKLHIRNSTGTDQNRNLTFVAKIVLAHGYFLIGPSSGYNGLISLDATYSSSGNKLVDNGGVYISKNTTVGVDVFDMVGFGTQPAGGYEGTAITMPPANQSLERRPGGDQGNGQDTDNNSADFLSPTASHPRNSQSAPQPPIQQGPICGNGTCETGENSISCPADCVNSGDIVINEFVADPVSSSEEWIELYNKTSGNVDLSDWYIEEGSGSKTKISGIIISGQFLIINTINGNLNNSGDTVYLKKADGTEIDKVVYGDGDNDLTDNAPEVADPNSTARKTDGLDLNIDNQDFVVTTTPTKGASNVITSSPPATPPESNGDFSPGDVVINEFMPNPAEGKEWIELYLNKNSDVNLEGWKVYDDNPSLILTLTGNLTTTSRFAVFELNSSRLNNDGDTVTLKSPDDATIDQVVYGKESNNAPVPDASGQSVARQSNGVDTDNDSADFALSDQSTKGTANVIARTETKSGSTTATSIRTVAKPVIYINEFVSDPTDNEQEWVEIYNAGEVSADLNGWTLEEGSKSKTALTGTIIPGQFKIISPINGSLNNDGDIIFLKDEMENIFDTVAYGNWNDGRLDDNAPAASDPASTARRFDGYFTGNPAQDFAAAGLPTKGKSNSSLVNSAELDNRAEIIINELVPDPQGDDSQEFVEIKNKEARAVNLTGWFLQDEGKKKYTINQAGISANGFYVIKRVQSGIALNNNVETLYLYAPNGDLKDKIDYQGAKEGQSWSRFSNGWQWTASITPEKENVLILANHPAQIYLDAPDEVLLGQLIELDASDSYDEDDDELSFDWLIDGKNFFGDSLKYSFVSLGEHTIRLAISDGKEEVFKEIKIKVVEKLSESVFKSLFISEVLPNPVGDDGAEWAELYYDGVLPLDLAGFKLDDEEGGSAAYKITEKKIFPGQYLIFSRQETKLAFNNTGDAARLFDNQGNLIQETVYKSAAPEGLSWSRQANGQYIWTAFTSGAANSTEAAVKTTKTAAGQTVAVKMTLKEARQADIGDKVRVSGVVSVTPGILGSQIFYLSGSGMQIFMSKKDFPGLKVGDLVEVTGELSQAQGERRVKVANKEDIKLLGNNQQPHLEEVPISEVGDDLVGSLTRVSGTVVIAGSGRAVLEDGGDELAVSIKKSTGIDAKIFTEGEQVRVAGILSQKANGLELLPRFKEDIEIVANASTDEVTRETLSVDDKAGSAKNYLAVTAGGLTSILVTLGLRNRLWRLIPFSLLAGFFRWKKKE